MGHREMKSHPYDHNCAAPSLQSECHHRVPWAVGSTTLIHASSDASLSMKLELLPGSSLRRIRSWWMKSNHRLARVPTGCRCKPLQDFSPSNSKNPSFPWCCNHLPNSKKIGPR